MACLCCTPARRAPKALGLQQQERLDAWVVTLFLPFCCFSLNLSRKKANKPAAWCHPHLSLSSLWGKHLSPASRRPGFPTETRGGAGRLRPQELPRRPGLAGPRPRSPQRGPALPIARRFPPPPTNHGRAGLQAVAPSAGRPAQPVNVQKAAQRPAPLARPPSPFWQSRVTNFCHMTVTPNGVGRAELAAARGRRCAEPSASAAGAQRRRPKMPPTLFQKLFNKKHGLISPARDARDDCVFR